MEEDVAEDQEQELESEDAAGAAEAAEEPEMETEGTATAAPLTETPEK